MTLAHGLVVWDFSLVFIWPIYQTPRNVDIHFGRPQAVNRGLNRFYQLIPNNKFVRWLHSRSITDVFVNLSQPLFKRKMSKISWWNWCDDKLREFLFYRYGSTLKHLFAVISSSLKLDLDNEKAMIKFCLIRYKIEITPKVIFSWFFRLLGITRLDNCSNIKWKLCCCFLEFWFFHSRYFGTWRHSSFRMTKRHFFERKSKSTGITFNCS